MSDVEPPEKEWLKRVVLEEEDDSRIKLDFHQKRGTYGDDNPTTDEDVTKVLHDNAHKFQDDKVHDIDFSYCKLITDTSLNRIGETFRHILKLDLYACYGITEEGISKVLSRNPNITHLYFGRGCEKVNGDAALQSVIDNCPSIETLIAEDVGITTIPTDIGTLQKLKLLDLDRNNITVVPRSILDLPTECKLLFDYNPLQEPPVSVIKDGRDAMIAYYEDLEKGARISNKLKFVLLGTGEAGKTTIANILNGQTDNYMPAKDDRTIHLDLMTLPIHKDGHEPITLTVYDANH
uniref:Roc domain-containing protein n=1 Tax=Chaetoceros debilis TaxID=122233 RepID=A0A7S3QFQ8_9STRA